MVVEERVGVGVLYGQIAVVQAEIESLDVFDDEGFTKTRHKLDTRFHLRERDRETKID